MSKLIWRPGGAMAAVLLASGCASLPLEQGRSNVQDLVQLRSPLQESGAEAAAQVAQWLQAPLSIESAQRIALLRSPAIQGAYAQLGLAAADVFEAARLHNPTVGLSWLLPLSGTDGNKLGASATLGFSGLLLRRSRQQIASAQFEATQQRIAAAVLEVLADAQQAWLACVATSQRVGVRQSIADAAALSAELADRYQEAGNLNALELQIQRAEASQAQIELQAAQLELADARARLQSVLGLTAQESTWSVPATLPEVPASAPTVDTQALQAQALAQRLDLAAAHRRAHALELQWNATRRYRLLGDVAVGAEFDREGDGARRLGPSLELGLPLFQQGQGAVARAQAELAAARADVAERESRIGAEVAQQLRRLELARLRVALYRDALIPQREAIVARLKERANFMLVDNFTVLLARQQEYAAYAGYVDATQQYWSTQVELLRVTGTQRSQEERP